MKKIDKVIVLFLCFALVFMTTNEYIYALYEKVLPDHNQVTDIGGENRLNTNGEEDGIVVSKTIEESNIENYFDITLKVDTTTKIKEITSQPDIAIVIVMDISNTMKTNKVSNNSNQTRYEAAIAAGETFINEFAYLSKGVSSKRQIGYVSFNTNVHKTFALQEVKSEGVAEKLINTMKTSTSNIINADGYEDSTTKYTNIEGGLKMAWDMLGETNVNNKYVILLSDGYPTTYLNNTTSNPYDGYSPYSYNVKKSAEGVFANGILERPCSAGVDYSDRGAIKARKMATNIKNDGIEIMVVGTGVSTVTTIEGYLQRFEKESFSTIDSNTTNYEIGVDTDPNDGYNPFENWLKTKIGSDKYYNSDDTGLTEAYLKIFNEIQEQLKISTQATWVTEDPMGVDGATNSIEFVGMYDDNNLLHDSLNINNENQSDTANFTNNKISWDLKNSSFTEKVIDGITYYTYEVKYRVRLQNELDNFDLNKIYETNGKTTLSYVIGVDGVLSETKYIDFKIPKVVGYLGNLKFQKQSSFNDLVLSGVKFKLIHDPKCTCHEERRFATIEDMYQVSGLDGFVDFQNIPSGHTYILTEDETLENHNILTNEYKIEVKYGETIGGPENNIIINDIKTGNLEIQKLVQGDVKNPYDFEFILEVYFNGNKLNNSFIYKINDQEEGMINLSDGILKLDKDDKMIIYGLPVGATYILREVTIDGFRVEHEVNLLERQSGEIAICSDNCRINEGDSNKVTFINTADYILPATGSSSMLILALIGIFLLGVPIVYTSYLFYKRMRNNA